MAMEAVSSSSWGSYGLMYSANLEKASFLVCDQFPLQAGDHRNSEKAIFPGYAFLLLNDV